MSKNNVLETLHYNTTIVCLLQYTVYLFMVTSLGKLSDFSKVSKFTAKYWHSFCADIQGSGVSKLSQTVA